jgi:hypothetical protein
MEILKSIAWLALGFVSTIALLARGSMAASASTNAISM